MADRISFILTIQPVLNRDQQIFSWPEADAKNQQNGSAGCSPPSTPSAWLFQSNPLLYDLRGALRSLTDQVWSVSRFAKRIASGDRVYLWEAGRWGGIAAVAEISEAPRIRPEPPEQIPFARASHLFAQDRLRAGLKILRVIEPLVARSAVIERSELRELGVLRCPRGTNFPLTRDQWHVVNSMVEGR